MLVVPGQRIFCSSGRPYFGRRALTHVSPQVAYGKIFKVRRERKSVLMAIVAFTLIKLLKILTEK